MQCLWLKQLTPRQGTKTLRLGRGINFPAETTYAPSGDENRASESFVSSIQETTHTPSGDENQQNLAIFTVNLAETTYAPSGDENTV